MNNTCDYYQLLHVSPQASQREIRNAFRNLVKRFHPDLRSRESSASHERLRQLIAAYHTLSNSDLRRQYNINRAFSSSHSTFNFRAFLQKRTDDYYAQARLIFYDLLHDSPQSACVLYERLFDRQRELKKYMNREDYMDCAFLLSEAYEDQGKYHVSSKLLIDIAHLELAKPYFRHFFTEVQSGLQRLMRKRLKKQDNIPLIHQDLRLLRRLNILPNNHHWKSLIGCLESGVAEGCK